MSKPRQPVKGKPHISCEFDPDSFPEEPAVFWWTDCDECLPEYAPIERWAEDRVEAWSAWWRQHQEAA